MSEIDAIQTLHRLAAVFEQKRNLSLACTAARLSVSVGYVRAHLNSFPGAFRLPGGDIRIPARDLDALAVNGQIKCKALI